ncbi:MAG: diaminobutyrate acetyltransferase [Luteitalea sp.]|nr:diaminobutyrate acetyltransferase [Luteitalea sp.]
MTSPDRTSTLPEVSYRAPRLADATQVHALVDACKPLDLNSVYAYMLLCTHFADTCAIAEQDGRPVGLVSGYLEPSTSGVLFIWQVAVSPTVRGRGVAKRLLEEVLDRPACRHVHHLETTITPSNEASWSLFRAFARDRNTNFHDSTLFRSEDFGTDDHEEEQLVRIGPF